MQTTPPGQLPSLRMIPADLRPPPSLWCWHLDSQSDLAKEWWQGDESSYSFDSIPLPTAGDLRCP
jgi:hypothetical protein